VFLTCDKQGANCSPPPYAYLSTFQINPWNYGQSLRYHADAMNSVGGLGLDSVPYEVLPEKPFNFTPPSISGVLEVGETVAATPGGWREPPYPATEAVAKSYQWFDCPVPGPGPCTGIPGANSSTLLLTPSDQGKKVQVIVTGSNRGGSTDVASTQTSVVAPPRPSPPRPPDPPPATTPTEPRPTDPPVEPVPPPGGTRPTTPMPDIVVSMSSNPAPGSIFGVTQITYTIDVNNVSDIFATNAVLTDLLPSNLSLVSATVNRPPLACSVNGQVVTCPLGDLPGHDSIRVVIVANVTSAVYTSNGASVTELQNDATPANNSASITHF